MTRSEELSLKAYPISTSYLSESNGDGDRNHPRRLAFIEGYRQAEKDLDLTWKDIKKISRILDIMVDDDFKGKIPEEWGEEEYYEEVLQRFNKAREAKK